MRSRDGVSPRGWGWRRVSWYNDANIQLMRNETVWVARTSTSAQQATGLLVDQSNCECTITTTPRVRNQRVIIESWWPSPSWNWAPEMLMAISATADDTDELQSAISCSRSFAQHSRGRQRVSAQRTLHSGGTVQAKNSWSLTMTDLVFASSIFQTLLAISKIVLSDTSAVNCSVVLTRAQY